jgi:hypothetical protein
LKSSDVPLCFDREYGCTEAEWRRWMPAATAGLPLREAGTRAFEVSIGAGSLSIGWTPLPPRVIALVRLPRMQVRFAFAGVGSAERAAFMRRLDMHLQRGGG